MDDARRSASLDRDSGPLVNPDIGEGYLPLELSLLRPGQDRPFDLYTANNDGRKVLFCAKGVAVSDRQINRLRQKGVRQLYVSIEQSNALQFFLQRILKSNLSEASAETKRQSRLLYSAACGVMADIMSHPTSPSVLNRGAYVAKNVVGLLLSDASSLGCLLDLFAADYYTYTHSVNVCVLGVVLCRRLHTGRVEDLTHLATGLLLHDLGKALIPTPILNKPGQLDDPEMEIMRKHSRVGHDLLRKAGCNNPAILDIVLQHHEKWDGTGYPQGLSGQQIELPSRIAAVADIFDALTTPRPHRAPISTDSALGLMHGEAVGAKIDGEILSHLKRVVRQWDRSPNTPSLGLTD